MDKRNFKWDFISATGIVILSLLSVYSVIWAFTSDGLFLPSTYNSYVLQALRWLEGHLDLGINYSYLEIAEFNGKYFISFPPIPSVVLVPFVAIFGINTPDTLIGVIVGIIGAIYALRLCFDFNIPQRTGIMYTLLLTIGSNFLHIGYKADVWYLAQILAFSFTMISLYYAFSKNQRFALSTLFLGLAVGCRPFNLLYGALIIVPIYRKLKDDFSVKKVALWFLPIALIGIFLMWLNYARFGNIMEFGHNYLPEFAKESPNGQFWIGYVPYNIYRMFRLPEFTNGMLNFPIFDGVAFWLVSPIVLVYIYYFIKKVILQKDSSIELWLSLILPIIHILVLCCHKTLGGWQFGNRYTVDILPVVFFGILMTGNKKTPYLAYPLLLWGIGINLAGTIALVNGWIG